MILTNRIEKGIYLYFFCKENEKEIKYSAA
jgi:hypothetical protein